jgi:hypothetical protein
VEVEINQRQHHRLNKGQQEATDAPLVQETQQTDEVVPGVSVIRSNTPRPLSVEEMISSSGQQSEPLSVPGFPAKAPSAPPLPEELGEGEIEEDVALSSSLEPLPDKPKPTGEDAQDFFWLFEYGLEMDTTILNSPERLDGLALLYGPAVLKGYSLAFGSVKTSVGTQTIVTIVPDSELGSEVWGVLYRIPRRVAESISTEPSLLDTIHNVSQNLFKATRITVYETYRDREVVCVTYAATEHVQQQLPLSPLGQGGGDALLAQRLAAIAKKQKLPSRYVSLYTAHTAQAANNVESGYAARPVVEEQRTIVPTTRAVPETPGPSMMGVGPGLSGRPAANIGPEMPKESIAQRPRGWLVVLALYLLIVLLAVFAFAVLQGIGFANNILTASFMPLGVPWLVLVYGLMGGCISSIITLGRNRLIDPPLFIIITWFARPYVGAGLAVLTYLLLTSGLFFISYSGRQYSTLFLVAGAFAGLAEGWLFLRHR